MAKTKQQKQETIKELTDLLKGSETSVFAAFNAITVEDERAMRRGLLDSGVGYKVAKKSLFNKALEAAGITPNEELTSKPEMQMAVAYTKEGASDTIAPAKGLADFIKDHKEQMLILGGIFEGKVMNQADMTELGTLPGLDVLRGMFVNVINSPIQGLVIALNAIAEKKA